jgi:hypothetical protein
MGMDRREFVDRSALVAGALFLSAAEWTAKAWAAGPADEDLLSQMRWLNEPASAKVSGSAITVRSRAKTDFWQKTFDGYIADSGHFFHLPASGDFTFTALVAGRSIHCSVNKGFTQS